MRVTAIKQQVKNPDRASLFVDGKYSFSLTLSELLDEKIKVGLEIDESQLKILKKRSTDGKLRQRTMEWLLNRPHSERELRDYLRRKKAEPEQMDSLVQEMQKKKYQDDTVFARWFAELRIRKQKSNRGIKAELRYKGVDSEVIDEVVGQSGDEELLRLKELIAKKRHLSRYQDKNKLMQYLVSQGYSFDMVKEALDET